MNKSSNSYRICRFLYTMYLQDPDKYYTANEIAKGIPSLSTGGKTTSYRSRMSNDVICMYICKGACDEYADIEIEKTSKPYKYRFGKWR